MKKNRMLRIASVLLVAVLLSTCAISGTFAKYTSTFNGSATATVAKWDVTVAEETQTFTVDFSNTAKEIGGASADAEVKAGVIAPGTQGSFTIEVTNNSEVVVEYSVELGNTTTLPITFTVAQVQSQQIAMGQTATITVNWVWPFDGTAATDMELAGDELTVDVTVTVTQVN